MRRRKLLVALAGLAVVAAAGAFVLWPRTDRITRANYDRIRMGMSRAEVYAILGPPGDYTTQPNRRRGLYWNPDGHKSIGVGFYWMGDAGVVEMDFNPQDDVVWRMDFEEIGPGERIEMSPLATLRWRVERLVDDTRWRAKRQWRKWFPAP
jgi:hypothetical protein